MNNTVKKQKLFTKSAFKIALECPNKLYYYRNPDVYANADTEDEFLQALAEGGFQVGELAKIYCGVPPENDIEELDYDSALRRTQELMQQEQVNIAEAAFRYGNLFVRVDVLQRNGDHIELIEVKAKSWNPEEDTFYGKKPEGSVKNDIRPYVYDVAFQKYVVTHALQELYPDRHFTVKARLMMADKSKTADINGLNQLFKIKKVNNRARVETAPDAMQRLAHSQVQVLTAFDVDALCDRVIAGETAEQGKDDFMLNMKFLDYVNAMSQYYCKNEPYPNIMLRARCFKCQFQSDGTDGKQDGYRECWRKAAHFADSDFDQPLVKDLWKQYVKCDGWVKDGIYKMADITEEQLERHADKKSGPGLDHKERKWLQIAMMTGNQEVLSDYATDIHDGVYLDIVGLKAEMSKWQFPLHMIDFETTAVALPYYVGMRPYEQVAFQFSHHIIEKTGDGGYTIRHAGQYLNQDVSKFPNFEFVRALREQLGHDEGTIFRYAPHENSILRAIYKQLEESTEPDKQELMDFIDKITHVKDKKTHKMLHQGKRDMVDLWEVVKRYFYEPKEMGGSNSIKVVLPAVLNASQFLKDKYSKPIYGKEIPSQNISSTKPIKWIAFDASGHVENPYHLLPSVSSLLDIGVIDNDMLEKMGEDITIANGGAALTAYNKLMFCDGDMTDALCEALLRYCELDTMAMVFIWEYFNHETKKMSNSLNRFGFKYPAADKIGSRTSTVARSMASTLMPRIKGVDEENDKIIWWKESEYICAYCGRKANHVDHLFPLVVDKYPSGYYSNPENLVPCCGDCNQSKGAKLWYDYMDLSNYITKENLLKLLLNDENILKNIYNDKDLLFETLSKMNNISSVLLNKDKFPIVYDLQEDDFKKVLLDLTDLKDLLKISEKKMKDILNKFSEDSLKSILNTKTGEELNKVLKPKKLKALQNKQKKDENTCPEDGLISTLKDLSKEELEDLIEIKEFKNVLLNLEDNVLKEVLTGFSKDDLMKILNSGKFEKSLINKKEKILDVLKCLEKGQLETVLKGRELIKELITKALESSKGIKDAMAYCLSSLVNNSNDTMQNDVAQDKYSNLLIIFLRSYLLDIINLKPEKRDSKEKILIRLLNIDKTENDSQVIEALKGLNKRKDALSDYCQRKGFDNNKFRLSFFDKKTDSNIPDIKTDSNIPDIKTWWDNMYNAIKDSLYSAQIQIDAFTAGIKYATEGNKICFEQYFINLLQEESKKSDTKNNGTSDNNQNDYDNQEEDSSKRLNNIGFTIDNNNVKFAKNTAAAQIYDAASKAYAIGSDYYNNASKEEQEKLNKLYSQILLWKKD